MQRRIMRGFRALYEKTLKEESLAAAYYEHVTRKRPVGFDRQYLLEAKVLEVPTSFPQTLIDHGRV